jgi:hypothetical protein
LTIQADKTIELRVIKELRGELERRRLGGKIKKIGDTVVERPESS